MLETNLESLIHIKFKFHFSNITAFVNNKLNKNIVLISKYTTLMDRDCIQHLYELIKSNHAIRSTNVYNNTRIPLTVAKEFYRIILSIDKNYVIPDNNIVKWLKINTGIEGVTEGLEGLERLRI
jgi:hypothetical protein